MAKLVLGDVTIGYDDHPGGSETALPVLLIAPGGLRSAAQKWQAAPYNPIERLRGRYRTIAMDQRNAGRSFAPIRAQDGWDTYTQDQLALLNHLKIDRFHVMGMCIGGSYVMGLIRAAPERVCSAVMLQPIGLDGNRDVFFDLVAGWRDEVGGEHPEADDAVWESFRDAMFGGDFLFNAGRDQVATCPVPILLMKGDDPYHPASISDAIAEIAPDVTYVEQWKTPALIDQTAARIEQFLDEHDPSHT